MTTQQFLTSAWIWQSAVIALCVVALAGYARLTRFQFSARSLFLLAAVLVLFLALASPIAVLANGYLFSAHMLQHLLLQLIVPPLVLLSFRPSGFGLRPSHTSFNPLTAILRRPLLTWFLGLGAMWLWHVPSLCSASATNTWVHLLQGVSLLVMGTAFWWPIIGPARSMWLPPLTGVLYLFSACVGCTILGIILTFAPLGVCPVFHHPVDRLGILPLLRDDWGLSPARDQQLGGLLMWVPPCFVYMCGIFGLLARWYSGPDPELAASPALEAETEHCALAPAHSLEAFGSPGWVGTPRPGVHSRTTTDPSARRPYQ
jgi:putative membrane protein